MSGLAERVADYADATAEFLAVADVDDALLDRHPEGEWSARQIIHHLADAEAHGYVRVRRLLAEPGSTILSWGEFAWSQSSALGYDSRPVATSIALFASMRAANVELLSRLSDDDLAREVVHSELGRYTLDDWLTIYTAHPRAHRAQLEEAVGA